ncbi:hypothetical protein [Deinococcus humi]|uniref:Uncharacterized membrane protein YebE (DUF533 family) n=1 Tax=Deinococcus humi TaxID=662880 RepID=A0A7W8JQE8_9DEIO|nr:hypothetical protein [Deinococcus humi]MBB5361310.1 uncharacterized membrane protein YebE (DUF533 family) [Deinococcus humi]GGO19431.1 hypothetical protein GCM10008949_03760 [Deinococcus humi]
METVVIQGVSPEVSAALTTFIGILAAALVGPLTSLWKARFKKDGPDAVKISAVLSALIGGGIVAYQAIQDKAGWMGVAVAVIAFVTSNGAYKMLKQASNPVEQKPAAAPQDNPPAAPTESITPPTVRPAPTLTVE